MNLTPDQHAALTAWWCSSLPQHTRDAETDGWTTILAAVNTDIRNGITVADSVATHGLPVEIHAVIAQQSGVTEQVHSHERGTLTDLAELGVPTYQISGDYRCPRTTSPCTRHAGRHPNTGREPDCHLTNTIMTYHPATR